MSGTTFHRETIKVDFLLETILLTQEFLDQILFDFNGTNLEELSHEYHWNKMVSKLTSQVSQFVELTTLMTKSMQRLNRQAPAQIKDSHVHLLFIMKGMGQAASRVDTVALEDLIKYELKDNLTQWKIDFIPQIKKSLKA